MIETAAVLAVAAAWVWILARPRRRDDIDRLAAEARRRSRT
jgi:hypothetical protein